MKLVKRPPILKNFMVFLTLSLVYLHVTHSLNEQRSAMDLESLKSLISGNRLLLGFYFSAMITTYFARRSSKIFVMMYLSFVFGQTFYFFLMSFDKLILLLNFTYLLFSFCFYLLWKLELDEAYYWPGFNLNDLKLVPEHNIKVIIRSPKHGQEFFGHMTNWNEKGCYIVLEERMVELRGQLEVEILYLGKVFKSRAEVVTVYGHGLGLSFEKSRFKENFTALNWINFYDIIESRGYKNRSLQRTMG